jgi:hypothetical protein
MEQTPDGGYVMGGYVKWTASGDMDGLVIKLRGGGESGIGDVPFASVRTPVAFPNPSSDQVRIMLSTEEEGLAEWRIYDLSGRLVSHAGSQVLEAGQQTLTWDGKDLHGRAAQPGIYFYHVATGEWEATGRVVLTK